ncbi:hypothetical protein [Nocardioides sp. BYT-33-1]|uniref:hypothetical protein n=1 Tax=Nocardioides sp. BYT-33-1 TaxID=3416952 RepID=UPI003F5335D2
MTAGEQTSNGSPVTCPECGTQATVALGQRDAADFCARCDYPLFWTPQTIQLGDRETDGATLRRLPGTAGQVTVASVPCPHCGEVNPLAAESCTRCGLPMVVAPPPEPDPEPEPVLVVPPPPVPEPEPHSLWWAWALLGSTALLLVALLVWWRVA